MLRDMWKQLITLVNTAILCTHSKAFNMMLLSPRIIYFTVLLPTGCHLHTFICHRFIEGSNPSWDMSATMNFSSNFLSRNFLIQEGELCSYTQ